MEYKKAIIILTKMLDKYSLRGEEREAVLAAVGTLDWGSLTENRMKIIIKAKKAKRDKSLEL